MESELVVLVTSSRSSEIGLVPLSAVEVVVRPDLAVVAVVEGSNLGNTGEVEKAAVSFTGDVGDSRSFAEPVESFVRFFLRKPRVGIDARK